MTILGIDTGSRITGFGIIEIEGVGSQARLHHINHGVIALGPTDPFPLRMKELGEAMEVILRKYRPHEVSIEKIFLGRNADSAFKLGHARGVALYESAKFGCEVHEYSTRLVKKGITGTGGASKEDVQACLQRLLNLKRIARIDASDALALAAYHAYQIMNPLHAKVRRSQNLEL